MKKLLVLSAVLAFSLTSCSKDEVVDCNCDKVTEVTSWSLGGDCNFGTYKTLNECTGEVKSYNWKCSKPIVGNCN